MAHIHWKGYTTGNILFHEERVEDARTLLENLIDEGVIEPYWEPGSESAVVLERISADYERAVETLDLPALRRFDFDKLFNQLGEMPILHLISGCRDQAYNQEFIIDGEIVVFPEI